MDLQASKKLYKEKPMNEQKTRYVVQFMAFALECVINFTVLKADATIKRYTFMGSFNPETALSIGLLYVETGKKLMILYDSEICQENYSRISPNSSPKKSVLNRTSIASKSSLVIPSPEAINECITALLRVLQLAFSSMGKTYDVIVLKLLLRK